MIEGSVSTYTFLKNDDEMSKPLFYFWDTIMLDKGWVGVDKRAQIVGFKNYITSLLKLPMY